MSELYDILSGEDEEPVEIPPRGKKKVSISPLKSRSAILAEAEKVYREMRKGELKTAEGKRLLEALRLFQLLFDSGAKSTVEDGANLDELRLAAEELEKSQEEELLAWEREQEKEKSDESV